MGSSDWAGEEWAGGSSRAFWPALAGKGGLVIKAIVSEHQHSSHSV